MSINSDLESVLSSLETLDETYVSECGSSHFIAITHKSDPAEVQLRANRAGLINLAKSLVRLALKESAGSHQTFDEAGMLDHCDIPLTVTLADAEWKS